MSMAAIDYRSPGPLTAVHRHAALLSDLPHVPVDICRVAQGLVIEPHDADALGVPTERRVEKDLRPAAALLDAVVSRGVGDLSHPCDPAQRVIGTCRHFATLSCALLRFRGHEARARCGFAGYFDPPRFVDHWVVEHRPADRGWARVDTEILDVPLVAAPHDLAPVEFLTGGEAWALARSREVDPEAFGVFGTENWGLPEIQGNAVRDLAALVKVEMLPWDEWGRMNAAYERQTGADYDELLDRLAEVCAHDSPDEVLDLSAHPDLAVPPAMVA